jgi:glycosyltransferase involved in cell wall biosynthesis
MKPLFLTRSFPPSVGGMERFSESLSRELSCLGSSVTIANRRGKMALPLFLPYAFAAAAVTARRERVDLIHLGDALLAPLGVSLRRITGLPLTATVHGLDMTFDNAAYQAVVGRALPKLDHIVAVSQSSRDICVSRWPALDGRVSVVPNGVELLGEAPPSMSLPSHLEAFLDGRRCLLVVGRLIRRKGVRWFVDAVMPALAEDTVLVVAGEGSERGAIEAAIHAHRLTGRVKLLGRVDDATLEALYRRADLFVMPNIAVLGDVEGFGLVAIEAAARGLPVLAADIEGIPEAIHHGSNGFLTRSGDEVAFAKQVRALLALADADRRALGARFAAYTRDTFSWARTAQRYRDIFDETLIRKHNGEIDLRSAGTYRRAA